MARYTGPACKLCRREGKKLYLKGERCTSEKCALNRRVVGAGANAQATAPGQHGAAKKKMREYGLQLREKQTTKRYYGVLEKQFKNYYDEAARKEGMTGENLLLLLERRLDNVVYRLGFAESRRDARQLVLHAHFTVNGKKVNIPSLIIKAGDVIAVKEASRSSDKFKAMTDKNVIVPKWLEADAANLTGKVVTLPAREDIDFDFNEQLIVELYSK
ncbi:MAG: 30S ribosomal protein S4 [Clostridia bacterium]|nr:30S ribosomal protein S4 [Clostridia bacterium]